MEDRRLTLGEVCALLGISNSSLYNIRLNSDLEFPKPKKSANRSVLLFSKNEIDEQVEKRIWETS